MKGGTGRLTKRSAERQVDNLTQQNQTGPPAVETTGTTTSSCFGKSQKDIFKKVTQSKKGTLQTVLTRLPKCHLICTSHRCLWHPIKKFIWSYKQLPGSHNNTWRSPTADCLCLEPIKHSLHFPFFESHAYVVAVVAVVVVVVVVYVSPSFLLHLRQDLVQNGVRLAAPSRWHRSVPNLDPDLPERFLGLVFSSFFFLLGCHNKTPSGAPSAQPPVSVSVNLLPFILSFFLFFFETHVLLFKDLSPILALSPRVTRGRVYGRAPNPRCRGIEHHPPERRRL